MTGRTSQAGVSVPEWTDYAACLTADPEAWFPTVTSPRIYAEHAKTICRGCFVRTQCLEDALAHDDQFGIFGGLTVGERKTLQQKRKAA